jgi:phage gpG-like protein
MAIKSVSFEGEKELRASLKAAGDDLSDLKAAHAETARTIAAAGQGNVAVRTGRLSGSIRGSGTKTAAIIRAGGGSIPYAKVIEFGWRRHNIEPQKYLTRAAIDTEPTWKRAYQDAVQRILAKVHGA